MSYDKEIVADSLLRIQEAILQISEWNTGITSGDDYVSSPDGMKTLAATCMLLEAIGEGVKKIDKNTAGTFLRTVCPDIPWKSIMGMRDHIAHGYFDIDADFVYDVIQNDLLPLKNAITILLTSLPDKITH